MCVRAERARVYRVVQKCMDGWWSSHRIMCHSHATPTRTLLDRHASQVVSVAWLGNPLDDPLNRNGSTAERCALLHAATLYRWNAAAKPLSR